jgi:phytoene synthase
MAAASKAPFADAADFEVCRALHREFGTTYYFSTLRLPPDLRNSVHALYGFVRLADEWVDNPGEATVAETKRRLESFRQALVDGYAGARPDEPVLRAFIDTARRHEITLSEPLCFLEAMQMDLVQGRYATYADLQGYMRGSAVSVGLMMSRILGAPAEAEPGARSLAEAMQLTNFLRDVGEDFGRGRIYLPAEDMARYGVTESDLREGRVTEPFRALMRFEIDRARTLYARADAPIALIPRRGQFGVRLARVLYAKILDRIEQRDYDVFTGRVRTSSAEKLWTAARLAALHR